VDQQSENREPAYVHPGEIWATPGKFSRFVVESGNADFRRSPMTWATLAVLLIGYPGLSLFGNGQDPLALLRSLDQTMLMIMLVATIFVQWAIFLLNYIAVYVERTGLAGVGLKRLRLLDFAWAGSFLLAANLILSGLAWLLGQLGHPMAGEVGLLIPKDPTGQVVWFFVAITAGFCEEIAFRGYIMTRLRLTFSLNSWWLPTVLSAVAFGLCHSYQGGTGLIVITVYGGLFSLLYIYTGSLWPCIIAHFFQDFGALFFPH
jgi:uncharacterized protein